MITPGGRSRIASCALLLSLLCLFYASDAESTKAHLETVDELKLPGIGFWHFSSVDDGTWTVVKDWLNTK